MRGSGAGSQRHPGSRGIPTYDTLGLLHRTRVRSAARANATQLMLGGRPFEPVAAGV